MVWSIIQGRVCPQIPKLGEATAQQGFSHGKKAVYPLVVYLMLFLLCLLAVGRILPWQAAFFVVLIMVFVVDRQAFVKVDYSLLFTFICFFIFIGNVGRIPAFRDFLQDMIAGREVYTAVIVSQVISNVPAALLYQVLQKILQGLLSVQTWEDWGL